MHHQQKKASTQIDTIISVSLFLLYLSWVFFFIRPNLSSDTSTESLNKIVETNIKRLYWNVHRIVLFVKSNISGEEPLILDFPLSWSYNNTIIKDSAFENEFFYTDEGRILIMPNLSTKNLFYIINSNFSYEHEAFNQIIANYSFLTTRDFRVDFYNNRISNITFKNYTLVKSFSTSLNNRALDVENTTLRNLNRILVYKTISKEYNNTYYVFAYKPRLYYFVDHKDNTQHNISLEFELANFTNFYSNNKNTNTLNYSNQKCFNITSDYIDFYNNDVGISFLLSKNSEITFCTSNDYLYLIINSTFNTNFYCLIVAHNSTTQTSLLRDSYYYSFGNVEVLSGINPSILRNTTYVYNILSQNFPTSRHFSVYITTHNETFVYGTLTSDIVNVYAKTIIKPLLYENGSVEDVKVSIATW